MSNLNGIDYGLDLRPEGQFIYTLHEDKLSAWFEADDALSDCLDAWEPIRNAAVSTGAFPFAFRTVDVIQHKSEFDQNNLKSTILPTQTFTYTDGGVFQNEPLGLAKRTQNLSTRDACM
jgi:hypothetical protein